MSAPAISTTTDFLAAVEAELSDLPAEDRSALLEDLALHLEALAAEDDDRPLDVRIGAPAVYAADLRAAAGLPARPGAENSSPSGFSERLARMRTVRAVRESLRLASELRPAWWVLRGYLAVLVPCQLISDWVRNFPVPAPLGSQTLGLLLVVAAVIGSVFLGRRRLPRAAGLLVAATGVLLVLVSIGIARDARHDLIGRINAAAWAPGPEVPSEEHPLLSRYGPVTDVYPYAADGTPLDGVLLYDQDGRPLKVGMQEWWADGCHRRLEQPPAADGVPVPNSYPQRYELVPGDIGPNGAHMAPGVCVKDRPRPQVPLPTFASATPDR
jgi:hypothetical protein